MGLRRVGGTLFMPFATLLLAAVTNASPEVSRDERRLERRTEKLLASIVEIQTKEESRIPPGLMRSAKGIVILKQYEAGVIFGAMGGFGVAALRDEDGHWGPPAWLKTAEISGGLQLGSQKLNVVLLFQSDDSLKLLNKGRFDLGIDATLTRGPTGSKGQVGSDPEADILVYAVHEGYYAGASFQGSVLMPDKRSNALTYGEGREIFDILQGNSGETPEFLAQISRAIAEIESANP